MDTAPEALATYVQFVFTYGCLLIFFIYSGGILHVIINTSHSAKEGKNKVNKVVPVSSLLYFLLAIPILSLGLSSLSTFSSDLSYNLLGTNADERVRYILLLGSPLILTALIVAYARHFYTMVNLDLGRWWDSEHVVTPSYRELLARVSIGFIFYCVQGRMHNFLSLLSHNNQQSELPILSQLLAFNSFLSGPNAPEKVAGISSHCSTALALSLLRDIGFWIALLGVFILFWVCAATAKSSPVSSSHSPHNKSALALLATGVFIFLLAMDPYQCSPKEETASIGIAVLFVIPAIISSAFFLFFLSTQWVSIIKQIWQQKNIYAELFK